MLRDFAIVAASAAAVLLIHRLVDRIRDRRDGRGE